MSDWIIAELEEPKEDKPILILCKDGSQHVGYRGNYLSEGKYVWIVGGWQYCHMCAGKNEIIFSKPMNNELQGTHWMPLPIASHE